ALPAPTPARKSTPLGGSLRANGTGTAPANVTNSARTFGANHSRGLPPIRWLGALHSPYCCELPDHSCNFFQHTLPTLAAFCI
ncbi:MAG: hypothetical protein ACKOEO_25635, partial [Planctomycetaceae bacterium]